MNHTNMTPAAGPLPFIRRVVLLIAAALSAGLVQGCLKGRTAKPPAGWVEHVHSYSRSAIYLPKDWEYMTADKAMQRYRIGYSPEEMMVFVQEKSNNQIHVFFHGWDGTDELRAKGKKQFLTERVPPAADLAKEGITMIQHVVRKRGGWDSAETVMQDRTLKSRAITLIVSNLAGAEQLVTIECSAGSKDFEVLDAGVFGPMLDSFVYARCKNIKDE